MKPVLLFLALTLLALIIQGFFSLFEMAAVSFNKVRLQYYVSQKKRRAIWLESLLRNPSTLFGTTLICVNTALQVGSECARLFYEACHLDPDWAPLSQVFLVVMFAELAPMFAARRHPEQIAFAGIPFVILMARIFRPITWTFSAISNSIHRLFGSKQELPLFLSREEVRMAFQEETEAKEDDFSAAATQIFQLKNMTAKQCMTPLYAIRMISSSATLEEVSHLLSIEYQPMIPVYHRYLHNIIGVAYLRDLLRLDPKVKVADHARSPWFVPREASILQILDQFRRNSQSVAVLLDPSGQACGFLTLDQIVEQIFGEEGSRIQEPPSFYIERTLSGEMSVGEFNRQFQVHLPSPGDGTLNDLIASRLDHPPVKGEEIRIGSFVFTVLEPTLRGAKTLSVQTAQE